MKINLSTQKWVSIKCWPCKSHNIMYVYQIIMLYYLYQIISQLNTLMHRLKQSYTAFIAHIRSSRKIQYFFRLQACSLSLWHGIKCPQERGGVSLWYFPLPDPKNTFSVTDIASCSPCNVNWNIWKSSMYLSE